jgi:Methylmalonyl-CoA mutase, N-terminal domain/subunit
LKKLSWVEFDRITERGGVLGAMETMYPRSKISRKNQMHYEDAKAHLGEFPIIWGKPLSLEFQKSPPTNNPFRELFRATKRKKKELSR